MITSIDKDSIIGQGYLKSVIINGVNKIAIGTTLSSIAFKSGNMINFDTLTSGNDITFNLFNLGLNHHKIYVRLNAKASCASHN